MANTSPMSQSRRRPKRQRTPTTIYTDDNPTTFTTKKKKGQNNGQHDAEDNAAQRSSSSKASSTGSLSADSSLSSSLEESMSMPPPAPVVKRGPGRPPRRKPVDQIMSSSGGKTRASAATHILANKSMITDASVVSPLNSVSSTTASGVFEQQSPPVVTKRKRGRPPKNRQKDVPVVSHSALESSQTNMKNNCEEELHDSKRSVATNFSSTTELQDANTVVDDENDSETSGRRSLPESSTTSDVICNENNHRSLDSTMSSQKKNAKCYGNNKNSTEIASTRNSNIKRKSKVGSSPLRFRARVSSSESWTSPEEDIEGTFVNHSVTLAPILPPVFIHDNDDDINVTKTNENCTEKPIYDGRRHNPSESSTISRQLKSKYPMVFDEGVPKTSSSIAPPFSSTSQISSGTSCTSSSKHKFNQSQLQLSQLPTWSPLYNPPVFFDDDYDRETGRLNFLNTIPVTRHITAMTVRKPDHDYLVLGDSVGFVTIYSLAKDNINLPIAQLESVACQQRGKAEQERLRADLLKRKKNSRGSAKCSGGGNKPSPFNYSNFSRGFSNSIGVRPGTPNQTQIAFASGQNHLRSILIDTSDTTIHALGMIENRVVLATSEELECMDVPSGTSLWVCPISFNRFVTSLDMHLKTFDVLVSCSKTIDSTEAVTTPISPLMLLQHSKNNVEICDANSPMLVRSPSCTAIWDIGASNRLLFIALSSNRQEHELVLVSGGTIDSWKVSCKTKIPTRASSATSVAAATKLSQSPGGIYTLVASSRGIRLYQTESLQLIHVYGDQLALHGQSVIWKDCWLAGSFFLEKNKNITKAARGLSPQWLQCDDWLEEMIEETKDTQIKCHDGHDHKYEKKSDLAPYIIGVPHTKGPKELCENLHVWKVEHPSVVPIMSIPLPHKAEGALGLVGSGNKSNSNNTCVTEDRIVLVTKDGQGHLLLPKMESNFAGSVYPAGYQVVTDNIEYIEDEDATDHLVDDDIDVKNKRGDKTEDIDDLDLLGQGDDEESMDEELREAMRQSLLEHNKHESTLQSIEYDTVVDILTTNAEKDTGFLPCRPEPYLRQMINTGCEGEEASENGTEQEKALKVNFASCSEMSKVEKIDGTETSEIEDTRPKLTDSIFISEVLNIMPNMPKLKPLEEDCLSFTTTKVVVAVNPVLPVRAGRGRKSRAANLETMLKASINPYLQSMMLSRQGVPVNGRGSRLKATTTGVRTNSLALTDESKDKLKPFSRSFSGTAETKLDSRKERMDGESSSSIDSSDAVLNEKHSTSPRQATNDEEAAVVMGLLGLSPCQATTLPSYTCVSSGSQEGEIGISAAKDEPKESAYLSSSSLSSLGVKHDDNRVISSLSSDRGSAVEGSEFMMESTVEKSKLGIFDKSCSACRGRHVIHSCGKRSLPIDYEEIARAEKEKKEKEEEEKKRIRAEKRRLADQKRREAKKQKQRELEEEKLREKQEKLEGEKHRRLQEDFASQHLNDQRRDQIVSSCANRVSEDKSLQMQAMNEVNSTEFAKIENFELNTNRLRQNFMPQSMNNCNKRAVETEIPQPHGKIFEQSTQPIQPTVSKREVVISYQSNRSHQPGNHVVGNKSGISSSAMSNENVNPKSSESSSTHAALPSLSSTLASADALIALANLAGLTKTLPITESSGPGYVRASNEPEYSSHTSSMNTTSFNTRGQQDNVPTFVASHGFGAHASLNDSPSFQFSGEMKRGIPSYATIRGQFSNEGTNDAPSAMTNDMTDSIAATASFSNGYARQTGDP